MCIRDSIVAAMIAHPELVSGTGRACAILMRACSGKAAVKAGAEGFYAGWIPQAGLGIAIKIDDGATRGAETVMARLLVLLGVADDASALIAKHERPAVRSWRGDAVGERRISAALDTLAS